MEGRGHLADLGQGQAQGEGQRETIRELGRIQGPVHPFRPGLLEVQVALDGVEGIENRRQSRFQRALSQDRGGEAVQGLDGGPVEIAEGAGNPVFLFRAQAGARLLQPLADAVAQLHRGGLGEGDDRDPVEGGRT